MCFKLPNFFGETFLCDVSCWKGGHFCILLSEINFPFTWCPQWYSTILIDICTNFVNVSHYMSSFIRIRLWLNWKLIIFYFINNKTSSFMRLMYFDGGINYMFYKNVRQSTFIILSAYRWNFMVFYWYIIEYRLIQN